MTESKPYWPELRSALLKVSFYAVVAVVYAVTVELAFG